MANDLFGNPFVITLLITCLFISPDPVHTSDTKCKVTSFADNPQGVTVPADEDLGEGPNYVIQVFIETHAST